MSAFLHLSIQSQVLYKCCIFPKDLIQACEMEGPKEMLLEDIYTGISYKKSALWD